MVEGRDNILKDLERCQMANNLVGILTFSNEGYDLIISGISKIAVNKGENFIEMNDPDFLGKSLKCNPIPLKAIVEVKHYKKLKGAFSVTADHIIPANDKGQLISICRNHTFDEICRGQ